jgi:hypothetical protein
MKALAPQEIHHFFAKNWSKSPKIAFITLAFQEIRHFFDKKLVKIAENCHLNIDLPKRESFEKVFFRPRKC